MRTDNMVKQSRRQLLKTGSIIGVAGLAGCVGGGNGGDDDVFTIGINHTETGDFAHLAPRYKGGYDAWEDIFQNQDVYDTDIDIEITLLDNESQEDRANRIAEQLITEEGANYMVSSYASPLTQAAGTIAETEEVPHISGGSADLELHQNFDYSFQIHPPYRREISAPIIEEHGIERIAVWGVDIDFARQGLEYFVENVVPEINHEVEVVMHEYHDMDRRDFSGLVLGAEEEDAEALITTSYDIHIESQLRDIAGSSWRPDYTSCTPGESIELYQNAGEDLMEGVCTPAVWAPSYDHGLNPEFSDTYDDVVDDDVALSAHSAMGFATLELVGTALEELGEDAMDGPTLQEWLENSNVETVLGPSEFDRGGQAGIVMPELQWQNGETEVVAPLDEATSDLRYPRDWPE